MGPVCRSGGARVSLARDAPALRRRGEGGVFEGSVPTAHQRDASVGNEGGGSSACSPYDGRRGLAHYLVVYTDGAAARPVNTGGTNGTNGTNEEVVRLGDAAQVAIAEQKQLRPRRIARPYFRVVNHLGVGFHILFPTEFIQIADL